MKKINLILLLTICITVNISAQSLLPIKKSGKWGAVDITGKELVAPTYDFMEMPKNGLSIVTKSGKMGVLNLEGKEISTVKYDKIVFLGKENVAVWENGKCGLLDFTGSEIVAPKYVAISVLGYGLFRTSDGKKKGVIDRNGEEILKLEYDKIFVQNSQSVFILFTKNKLWGLMTTEGDVFLEAVYNDIEIGMSIAKGYKGKAITTFDYISKEKKQYPNAVAFQQTEQFKLRAEQRKLAQEDPKLLLPRWTQELYRYKLTNAFGKNFLGKKEFFDIGSDSKLNLTLAREIIGKDTIVSYLVDDAKTKILFSAEVSDIMISDFNVSKYARATIDTLWDGLITKTGTIKRTVTANGQEVRFANLGNFEEGLAWIFDGKKFGFINTQAKAVIGLKYEIVSDFKNGHAIARKNGKFGAIDKTGKEIIPFMYDGIAPPQRGLFRVKKGKGTSGKWGMVNKNNQIIVGFKYTLIGDFSEGQAKVLKARKFGFIDIRGREIVTPTIEVDEIWEFKNGIAKVGKGRIIEKTNERPIVSYKYYGYIDKKGKTIIAPEYSKIENFTHIWQRKGGLCKITKNHKIGYINYKGDLVLEAKYTNVSDFENVWLNNKGISKAEKDGKVGYLNHRGEERLPVIYDFVAANYLQVWKDSSGIAKASKDGKFGYIDVNGVPVIPFRYHYISDFTNGIALVRQGKKWGVINRKKEVVIDIRYAGIRFLEGSKKQLLQVYDKQAAFYYINDEGKITKTTFIYDASETKKEKKEEIATVFSPKFEYETPYDQHGLSVVIKDGKRAIVDKHAKLITKLKYMSIGKFNDGLALVKVYSKDRSKQLFGYIDTKGKEVIPPKFKVAGLFSNGRAAVKKGLWGYIDKSGTMVIPPKYRNAAPFSDGKAIVNDGVIIDTKGTQLGEYTLKGTIKGGFVNNRAIVETTSGMYHIRPDGQPAYFKKADDITPYNGKVAFVKMGEVWELSRYDGRSTSKVKFSRTAKNNYLSDYGKKRKIKDKYGHLTKDLGWELVNKGFWRMIDQNGKLLSEIAFTSVENLGDGNYRCKVEQFFGVANLNGKFITKPKSEIVKQAAKEVFRLETGGKIAYLKTDGTWVYQEK